MPRIRRALPSERGEVVATVAAAFAKDPAWLWLLSPDYERLAPHFAGALFDVRVSSGNVWVSQDVATVAMWDGPAGDAEPPTGATEIWARYQEVAGEQARDRLADYRKALAGAAPEAPYWYLGVLATHPARQREGLATAILAPVLKHADRDGLPCCLETSTEANRRFYARRGFTEPTEVALESGPPTWWLRRPSRRPDRDG